MSLNDEKNQIAPNVKPDRRSMTCSHCNMRGHDVKTCFQLHPHLKPASYKPKPASAFAAATSHTNKDVWHVDTGASQHICVRRDWFSQYVDLTTSVEVSLGDGRIHHPKGVGSVEVLADVDGQQIKLHLDDVLYVPSMTFNLLSTGALDNEYSFTIKEGVISLFDYTGKLVANAPKGSSKLYELQGNTIVQPLANASTVQACAAAGSQQLDLWHQRLGHLGMNNIQLLKSKNMVEGLTFAHKDSLGFCEGCVLGKQTRLPFTNAGATRATDLLELVHIDLNGKQSESSIGGANYFMLVIDDFSRYTSVYFIKNKDDALKCFDIFKRYAELKTGKKLKAVRSDNGGEFSSNAFHRYCSEAGIVQQFTVVYTPEQNGVAERANRTIIASVRAMLQARNLETRFWAEATATAVYVKNRSPHVSVPGKTPYEVWTGRKPNLKHLRVFGCDAYAMTPKALRSKLNPNSVRCMFVGYSRNTKAYRLFNFETEQVDDCRDVVFNEAVTTKPGCPPIAVNDVPIPEVFTPAPIAIPRVVDAPSPMDGANEFSNSESQLGVDGIAQERDNLSPPTSDSSDTQDSVSPLRGGLAGNLRRSVRERHPPSEWWVATHTEYAHVAYQGEPYTFAQALKSQESTQWREAAEAEYASLMKNECWTLCELPAGRKAIGCKWVFKVKTLADGTVDRYKARLVAKGYAQTKGMDYEETFAPVAKFASIRLLLALAAAEDMVIHQMDVKTAFLNGELNEEIYMEQPEGFVKTDSSGLYCKLLKSLYGLKQAPRCWNKRIDAFFKSLGFNRCSADHGIYVKNESGLLIIVALYVDDLMIFSHGLPALRDLKGALSSEFEMSDLGEISYCLGMVVKRDRAKKTISLSQTGYIKSLLVKFNMEKCDSVSVPLDPNVELSNIFCPKTPNEVADMTDVPYREAIGSLMYASLGTRPDLAFAMCKLSKFSQNPGRVHWNAVKRLFKYLQGTQDIGLVYNGSLGLTNFYGYCDSDFNKDVDNSKSIGGYMFLLSGAAITWSARQQDSVAQSSTEAEYYACGSAAMEVEALQSLLQEVGYTSDAATIVKCDNESAEALVKDPVFPKKSRHIRSKFHYVWDLAEKQVVKFEHCNTKVNLADCLTKPLPREPFNFCRDGMGLRSVV